MGKHGTDKKLNKQALELIKAGKNQEAAQLLKRTSRENQLEILKRFEHMRRLLGL